MKKIIFDIETRNTFEDVGKADPTLLDLSVVCAHDSETGDYLTYTQEELLNLWPILEKADMLIGYNSDHFDIPILNKYYPGDLTRIKSLDILKEIKKSLGRRIRLNLVAEGTLGRKKTGNGLEAVVWWKNGEIDKIKKGREERIFQMCEKLAAEGAKIDPERVFAIAGHRDAGRPHVAKALVEAGCVPNFKEAFNRYIDFKGPAYVAHYKLAPTEAIRLVVTAGGVPVFAHPAISNADEMIPDLVAAGLKGIEVYHPTHGQSRIQHYSSLAEKYHLLMTGGTDYHGPNSGREIALGALTIPDALVEKLKNEHLRGN